MMVIKRAIRQVAIIGAGNMGVQIAAMLVNSGISCMLLDIRKAEEIKDNEPHKMWKSKRILLK